MERNSYQEIEEAIRSILVSELEIDPDVVGSSASATPLLGRGIGLDSVDALILAGAIENRFDIRVDDADLTVSLFKTIGTLAEYVLRKTSAPTAVWGGGRPA